MLKVRYRGVEGGEEKLMTSQGMLEIPLDGATTRVQNLKHPYKSSHLMILIEFVKNYQKFVIIYDTHEIRKGTT